MLNNRKNIDILERYLDGTATAEEQVVVEKWYNSLPEEHKTSLQFTDQRREKLYQRIVAAFDNTASPAGTVVSLRRLARYAAAILVLVVAGYFTLTILRQPAGTEQVADAMAAVLKPGGNRATLRLNNGKIIDLDSMGTGSVATEGGMEILKTANGEVVYKSIPSSGEEDEIHYNTITTPAGGMYQVLLPDGSKVTLNSMSSIEFPTQFNAEERLVKVSGELYFEVTKSKTPFIADVPGKQRVTVLGTEFNLSAYPDENLVATTLVEGKVLVNDLQKQAEVKLDPGQQSLLKNGRITTNNNPNIEQVTAWKSGYFYFAQTPVPEIMKQVARWYGATVTIDPAVAAETFSGKIPRRSEIQDLMRLFEQTGEITCEINQRNIVVRPKK